MNSHPNSESLVRARHRAARAVPPLSVAAVGLAVMLASLWLAHPSVAPIENWRRIGSIWGAGLVLTLIAVLAVARARRRTLLRSAAETDAAFDTHNRLEAATALQDAADPMARAQREETERFLQQSRLAPRRRGLTALAALTAALALAHIGTFVCWTRPLQPDLTVDINSAAVQPEQKLAAPPTATIEWNAPETETSATAIEEVPLEAEADSTTGLRGAVLELEVNGEHRLSQPLKEDLSQPGRHTLKLSIYLDQLDVKTYDMVSYHLTAQRISGASLPPTVSPVQFVQIKPAREDTFICAGGDQPSKCFNYVTALKASQLRLLKENFVLAHPEISKDNPEWQQENSRVGSDQNRLASRADEVIELMTTNHYPEPILTLVRESQPLMTDAGGKIIAEKNQPALEPQGKALGYLTEVEKYLKHSIKLAGQSKQPKASDPFDKPKNLELKTHPLTRAGKVDALAREQSRLAGDLASGDTNSMLKLPSEDAKPDSNEIAGTPGERQSEIKRRIEEFLNDPGFENGALKHLQASDDRASEARDQIARQDFAAASEPAAEAARELRQTAAALRAGGQESARNKLADALLQLASAAGSVRKAAHAKSDAEAAGELKKAEDAVRDAAKRLEEEARRQQANGATNAAGRLDEMAKLLQGEGLKQMLARAQQSPRDSGNNEALARRLDELAQRAGEQRNPGELSRQELAKLVDRLHLTQANLKNLASQCQNPGSASGRSSQSSGGASPQTGGSPNDPMAGARGAELSREEMQRAEALQLLDDVRLGGLDAHDIPAATAHVARLDQLLGKAAQLSGSSANVYVPLIEQIEPPLSDLINVLEDRLGTMRRPFELTSKEVSQAPPGYRPAVADYFEQLSRDYPAHPGAQ